MRKARRLVLMLAGALLCALAVPHAAQARATAGRMGPVRTQPLGPAPAPKVKGVRRIPRVAAPTAPRVAMPQAGARGVIERAAAAGPGTVRHNWDGVSSLDSAVTNFGQEFEPPDQALCAGNGFVMEMVNSAYSVYRTSGTKVAGPFNVNGPFNEGLVEFTSDPRCYYDASTNTWFATILYITSDFTTASHVDVAVNTSGDPTKLWRNYQIDTTDTGGSTGPSHAGCPCLGDQPTLGIDGSNLYVTTNEFSLAGPEFNGAQIYAIAKRDLVDEVDAPHFVHFDDLTIGGTVATSVQPALTTGHATAEYFLNSLDPNGTFDDRIGLWAMTDRGAVALGGTPKLASRVIRTQAYGIPPQAEQKGADSVLDTGDDRMQQVQFIDGSTWGELDTALTIPGDPQPRAAAAWFELRTPGSPSGATLRRQGYVAAANNHVMFPALQATPSGAAVMVASLSGPNRYPSAAYAELAPGARSFGRLAVYGPGTGPYDPSASRWGDYSWAQLDPGGASVWLATEYVPRPSRQTPDRATNWGTRVAEVVP